MKQKLRLLFPIAFIALATVIAFSACRSSVYLTRGASGDGYMVYYVTLRLCLDEEFILNNSATQAGQLRTVGENAGQPWTVVDYFTTLGSRTGITLLTPQENQIEGNFRYLVFRRIVFTTPQTQIPATGTPSSQTTAERVNRFNPFVSRYRLTLANPFNDLHTQYTATNPQGFFRYFLNGLTDNAAPLLTSFSGGQVEMDDWARREYWVNTYRVESVTLDDGTTTTRHHFYRNFLPPFNVAFPFAQDNLIFNPNNFTVNFVISSNARYRVFGDDFVTNGSTTRYYTFVARFDGSPYNQIILEYLRPNPIGWYVTAIIVGGLVVFLIIFITKKLAKSKKNKAFASGEVVVYGHDTFGR